MNMKTHKQKSLSREKQLKLLYENIKVHKLAVVATVTQGSLPEAAVIGFAVTKKLEIICSTFYIKKAYKYFKKSASGSGDWLGKR